MCVRGHLQSVNSEGSNGKRAICFLLLDRSVKNSVTCKSEGISTCKVLCLKNNTILPIICSCLQIRLQCSLRASVNILFLKHRPVCNLFCNKTLFLGKLLALESWKFKSISLVFKVLYNLIQSNSTALPLTTPPRHPALQRNSLFTNYFLLTPPLVYLCLECPFLVNPPIALF